jgi:hypothetical protein
MKRSRQWLNARSLEHESLRACTTASQERKRQCILALGITEDQYLRRMLGPRGR